MLARRRRAYHFAALCVAFTAMHDVETHHFENGVTLHVAPGHTAPVAAVQAWVGVGSADELPQQAGLAHVTEHMLFKGSSEYGLGELARAIERGGGEINAWTSFDQTVYHAVLGRDHVDTAIDAMGDALLAPRVDTDELAREREVILEEIRQGSDDPARSVAQSLFATAYVAHPYRRPVIGTADAVKKVGERELVEFFRTHYTADNLTLVVAGDVDPARVAQRVARRFRAMPSGKPARRRAPEPPQQAPRAVAAFRDVSEAYLGVGFHVPPARHPDLAALDVASILLGQTESARLPRLLRDDATSAYAHVHALRDPGLLVLSATTRPRDAEKAVGKLVDHTLGLVDDLASEELDKARVAVEANLLRQLETAQGRARSIGWHATVAGDPHFAHVYLDRIRGVRRHDVARVLHRYLRPDNASVAAILPPRPRASGRSRAAPPKDSAMGSTEVFARDAEKRVRKALSAVTAPSATAEKRIGLPSGMTLLVRRDPTVPVVAMRAVWRGGLRVEDDAHAGASTLLARLITRGCGKLDAAQVADRVDRLGGSVGGVAGRNSFGISAEFLARAWQPGLELLADCILAPQLPSAELAREKRLLLDDQVAQADNSSQVAFRLFTEALYGNHPYRRDVLGTADSVGALSRAELDRFYRARYPVGQLVLAIVGDLDVDEVVAAVTARFASAPVAKPATTTIAAPAFDGRTAEQREVYRFLDRAQSHLVVGFPGATVSSPDRFALEVLIAILGGQGGRLFAELREKQALVYRVSAHSVEGLDPGFVAIYLSCAPDKLEVATSAVRGELDKLRSAGITADELARAKSYLVGSHQIAMQRRAAVANAMAYHEAYGLGWRAWSDYDARIEAVTADDVAAAATAYLRDDRAITATVRPPVKTPAATKKSRLPEQKLPPVPPKHGVPRPRGQV